MTLTLQPPIHAIEADADDRCDHGVPTDLICNECEGMVAA